MYRENYINSLRAEMVEMVSDHLTPVAMKYGYTEVPLEANIKWRPQVLLLGNYSSGKSTLINEFLGTNVQATGQAPTDDSFTIITYDDAAGDDANVRVTEIRDGKYLLNDPEFPFENLKKHGQRFVSHFRLKKVNSPFLKNLALIDTPGMLDSITERDRGYNYQDVIGDLAQIADLVLVLFDPHKAGTVREAHESLRETLPTRTFEDRLLFVLNRIDECASMIDLLRVYGTLCWNLSQITGRKDIPMIHLTYSASAAAKKRHDPDQDLSYLKYLENQREELKQAIFEAPRHRLDHLAAFVETHGERLTHFIEALINYRKHLRRFRFKFGLAGLLLSVLGGAGAFLAMMTVGPFAGLDQRMLMGVGGVAALVLYIFWLGLVQKSLSGSFHRKQMGRLADLTPLNNQTRRDNWEAIASNVKSYLEKTQGNFSSWELKQDYAEVKRIYEQGSQEIREALSELAAIKEEDAADYDIERPYFSAFKAEQERMTAEKEDAEPAPN